MFTESVWVAVAEREFTDCRIARYIAVHCYLFGHWLLDDCSLGAITVCVFD